MQIKSEHISFLGTKDASPDIYNPKKTLDFYTMSLNETYAHLNIANKLRADTINCSLCSKNFKSFRGEATHRETFHVEKSEFKCKECDEKFTKESLLFNHMWKSHQTKTFYCKFCPKKFGLSKQLYKHMDKAHQKERSLTVGKSSPAAKVIVNPKLELQSPKDKGIAKIAPRLRSPEAKAIVKQSSPTKINISPTGRKTCEICKASFNSSSKYFSHMWIIHQQKCCKCHICGLEFHRSKNLYSHLRRVHKQEKGAVEMENTINSSMTKNISIEKQMDDIFDETDIFSISSSKETGFANNVKNVVLPSDDTSCKVCGQLFSRKINLQNHMWTEHQIKAFVCPVCNKKYHGQKNLAQHKKTSCQNGSSIGSPSIPASKPTRFQLSIKEEKMNSIGEVDVPSVSEDSTNDSISFCEDCGEVFTQVSELALHVANVHKKLAFTCDICSKEFISQHTLNKHKGNDHMSKFSNEISAMESGIINEEKSKKTSSKTDFETKVCEACDTSFKTDHIYHRHMWEIHEERCLECEKCQKKFVSKMSLREHIDKCLEEARIVKDEPVKDSTDGSGILLCIQMPLVLGPCCLNS